MEYDTVFPEEGVDYTDYCMKVRNGASRPKDVRRMWAVWPESRQIALAHNGTLQDAQ